MADQKVTSNGNVEVWAIPVASVANINSPTAAEINAGIYLADTIAWGSTTYPSNAASNDVDDRSLRDKGNAKSRGFGQFAATLTLYRPLPGDTTSLAAIAWAFFKTPRVDTILVTRVLQGTEGVYTAAVAGQWISAYQFITDTVNDNTAGEDSYKYEVKFLPQGSFAVNTQVKNATAVSLAPLTLAVTVTGPGKPVRATLGGSRATQAVVWASNAPNIATVSANGVVKGISAGTANITATHASATGVTTPCVVTVT